MFGIRKWRRVRRRGYLAFRITRCWCTCGESTARVWSWSSWGKIASADHRLSFYRWVRRLKRTRIKRRKRAGTIKTTVTRTATVISMDRRRAPDEALQVSPTWWSVRARCSIRSQAGSTQTSLEPQPLFRGSSWACWICFHLTHGCTINRWCRWWSTMTAKATMGRFSRSKIRFPLLLWTWTGRKTVDRPGKDPIDSSIRTDQQFTSVDVTKSDQRQLVKISFFLCIFRLCIKLKILRKRRVEPWGGKWKWRKTCSENVTKRKLRWSNLGKILLAKKNEKWKKPKIVFSKKW